MAGGVKGDEARWPSGRGAGIGPSVLALGAMVVATATPYLVAVLAPFLIEALALSPAMYGTLAGAAYAVAAGASRTIGGVTDRMAVGPALVALMGTAGLSWWGLAVANGFWWAMVAVAVGGVSLAASNPLTNRLVAEARPRNVGLAVGVKQAGVPLSALLIGAVAPALANTWGWRLAICALLPVPMLLAFWGHRRFRGSGRRAQRPSEPARATTANEIRYLARYAGLMGVGGGLLTAFLPLFAVTLHGSSTTTAGLLVALTGAIGIGARILWAALSQRVPPTTLLLALGVGAVAASGLLLVSPLLGSAALVIACVLAGLTALSWLGVAMVAVLRLHPAAVGESTGSVSRAFYVGLLVAPVAGGLLLEHTHSYQLVWLAQAICFGASTSLALVARATASQ